MGETPDLMLAAGVTTLVIYGVPWLLAVLCMLKYLFSRKNK